jgi:tetratricopeptide (TPR) repeat protein
MKARRLGVLVLLGLAAGLAGLGAWYWPERDLRAARAALAQHAYEAARSSLQRYLEARPASAEAHLLLAQLDRRSNRYADAVNHLEACGRLGGPADVIALERALGAIQRGSVNPEWVRLCYEHLSRENADPADQYLILEALSQGFMKIYRLTEALACLEQMLTLQPDSNYAYRRRAWIHEQQDNYDAAEADYRRALEIDAEDKMAALGLAQILLDKRQNGAEAAVQFQRLWEAQQSSAVVVGLAQSWRLVGRGEDARRLLDEWLKSHSKDALALAERGRLARDEGDTEQAVTLLRQAVTLAPYLRDANYTLYLCLQQQGRAAEAEACQTRIREAKEAHEQVRLLTKRLQEAPNDPDLRCQIAKLFLRFGGEEEGIRWLLTILQQHPRHAATHLALADYYADHGQAARAAEHRRLAGQ